MTTALIEQINSLSTFETVDRHSFFQLQYFVIGKEPTIQAKLWRCLQEINHRKDSLESARLEIEEVEDQILLLKENIRCMEVDNLDLEGSIALRQKQRRLKSTEKTLVSLKKKLVSLEEETKFFIQAFISLEKKEKLKPYDDFESQKSYWNEKLYQELKLKITLQQPISPELVQTILALPSDCNVQIQTVSLLENLATNIKQVQENCG